MNQGLCTLQPSAAPHTEGRTVRWARLYDLGTTLLSFGRLAALHRTMVGLAGIRSGERVLDVGCGPGRLAIVAGIAAGPAGETCGIDLAPEMVELARRRAAQVGVTVRFEVGVIEVSLNVGKGVFLDSPRKLAYGLLAFRAGVAAHQGRELVQVASRHAIQRSPGRVEETLEGRGARDPRSSVSPNSCTSRVQNSAHSRVRQHEALRTRRTISTWC
jgi:SAM-dependent methyltransferase